MSLPRTIAFSSVAGAALAAACYVTLQPAGAVLASQPVNHQAVPTPTVTRLADCVPPAVLESGECVTHLPGPVIVRDDSRPSSTHPEPESTTGAHPMDDPTHSPSPTTTYTEHDDDESPEPSESPEHSESPEPSESPEMH